MALAEFVVVAAEPVSDVGARFGRIPVGELELVCEQVGSGLGSKLTCPLVVVLVFVGGVTVLYNRQFRGELPDDVLLRGKIVIDRLPAKPKLDSHVIEVHFTKASVGK
jgi:hypothetical protein